jgi:C4-type Zn-finger protein
MLDKYCTNECTTCGGKVEDVSSYENSNPDTIEIILDGGTAENK